MAVDRIAEARAARKARRMDTGTVSLFGNGFSAMLFERLDANQQPTGQYTLAIAGSISPIDFANDLLDLISGGVEYWKEAA